MTRTNAIEQSIHSLWTGDITSIGEAKWNNLHPIQRPREAKETFLVGDRMSSDRHKRIHHRYGSLSRDRSSKAQIKPREGNALHNRRKVTQIQTLYRHEIVEQVDGAEPRIYSTTTICSNCKDKGFIWRNVTAHVTSSTQKKQTDSKIEQLVNGWKPIGCA